MDGFQGIQQLVNNLNNDIFLNENNLEGLISLLMLDKECQFDDVNLNDSDFKIKIESILKIRTQYY